MKNFIQRFKNYGTLIAIASAALLMIQTFGIQIDAGKYTELVNTFLGLLVALGIVSNPLDGKGFTDAK